MDLVSKMGRNIKPLMIPMMYKKEEKDLRIRKIKKKTLISLKKNGSDQKSR